MSRALRPASPEDVRAVERAVRDIRSARANLRKAGAIQAARRVAKVIPSVEGALRHVLRRRNQTPLTLGCPRDPLRSKEGPCFQCPRHDEPHCLTHCDQCQAGEC